MEELELERERGLEQEQERKRERELEQELEQKLEQELEQEQEQAKFSLATKAVSFERKAKGQMPKAKGKSDVQEQTC